MTVLYIFMKISMEDLSRWDEKSIIYLMEARGGGMRRGDKQRLVCLEILWTAFIGEQPQVELTPVATDDKEVCEGDAFPLCWLPVWLAGLAQRASKDAARAGDGDLSDISRLLYTYVFIVRTIKLYDIVTLDDLGKNFHLKWKITYVEMKTWKRMKKNSSDDFSFLVLFI